MPMRRPSASGTTSPGRGPGARRACRSWRCRPRRCARRSPPTRRGCRRARSRTVRRRRRGGRRSSSQRPVQHECLGGSAVGVRPHPHDTFVARWDGRGLSARPRTRRPCRRDRARRAADSRRGPGRARRFLAPPRGRHRPGRAGHPAKLACVEVEPVRSSLVAAEERCHGILQLAQPVLAVGDHWVGMYPGRDQDPDQRSIRLSNPVRCGWSGSRSSTMRHCTTAAACCRASWQALPSFRCSAALRGLSATALVR